MNPESRASVLLARSRITPALVLTILCLALPSSAGAAWTPAPPSGSGTVIDQAGTYDYGPSVIEENGVQYFWWCGGEGGGTQGVDHIYHQRVNVSTGARSHIYMALAPSASGWDSTFVCDPAVVRGQFSYNGSSYAYAMYYTGTNTSVGGGINNAIGMAYSNDGINWVKHGTAPVIGPNPPSMPAQYGIGQPAAWNRDGNARVTLFYTDSGKPAAQTRTTVPGDPEADEFGAATSLSNAWASGGMSDAFQPNWNADFAVDGSAGMLYRAQPGPPNLGSTFKTSSAPGTNQETYEIGLYRQPIDQALAGGGPWQYLGSVSTALTGRDLNFAPGFLRDGNGNLAPFIARSGVEIFFGQGNMYTNSWSLGWQSLRPGATTVGLNRWQASSHRSTTGYQAQPANLEQRQGSLELAPQGGQRSLWLSCRGHDGVQFVSVNLKCEGVGEGRDGSVNTNVEGTLGWAADSAAAAGGPSFPLYRCETPVDYILTPDPGCEGQRLQGLLGYAFGTFGSVQPARAASVKASRLRNRPQDYPRAQRQLRARPPVGMSARRWRASKAQRRKACRRSLKAESSCVITAPPESIRGVRLR